MTGTLLVISFVTFKIKKMDFRTKAQLLVISGFKTDDFYIGESGKIYVIDRGSNFINFSDGSNILICKSKLGFTFLKGKRLESTLANIENYLRNLEYLYKYEKETIDI